jgi:hypothetical protein
MMIAWGRLRTHCSDSDLMSKAVDNGSQKNSDRVLEESRMWGCRAALLAYRFVERCRHSEGSTRQRMSIILCVVSS